MRVRWAEFDQWERAAFQAVVVFLLARLEERQSLYWALRLTSGDRVKRAAVLAAVDREARKIAEPWRSAWRLIEESWESGAVNEQDSTGAYAAKKRLQEGDRSGAAIRFITDLVAPRLKLEVSTASAKRPRRIDDLLSMRLTSGAHVEPHTLGIDTLTELGFLLALARELEAALSRGLECARRTGWGGRRLPWQIGSLHRVYYVSDGEGQDPDKYHRGIAPSVKLLHETVSRLAALQPPLAREFVRGWKVVGSPVHLRLWAALARNAALVEASDVAQVLLALDDEQFWSLHYYPELAELRARRFPDFDAPSRSALTKRIRRLPPRRLWRRRGSANDLERARVGRAIEEFRRIQGAGGALEQRDAEWLTSTATAFPDIPEAVPADYGFTPGARSYWVGPSPDRGYDALSGVDRLKALEAALSEPRRHWNDDPARRASDWLQEENNALKIVSDLGSVPDAGAAFPGVWKNLGTAHRRAREGSEQGKSRNLSDEAQQVFSLLHRLQEDVARQAIEGIAHWLSEWREHFTSGMADLWLRLWPLAADATNTREPADTTPLAGTVKAEAQDAESRVEGDTLATPAGQLVGVFLSVCPEVRIGSRPFDSDLNLRAMRDAPIQSTGRARLIALHRMVEHLSYFLLADPDWAQKHLVETLNANDPQAIALWHAIARETRFHDVLKSVGDAMAQRAADQRLSRETRESLAFSVVIECLHALKEARDPAVPYHRVQQMLRSVENEVRVHVANAVQRFMAEVSSDRSTPEDLFQRAVTRLLHDVWPQERSLVTPGISQAFAKIPANAAGVFPAAVSAVERFLIPFDCWGMYEYGLDTDEGDLSPLARIDNPEKAAALLRLLDLTIGSLEGSVIPDDLSRALQQVGEVGPKLVNSRAYQRLVAASRRA